MRKIWGQHQSKERIQDEHQNWPICVGQFAPIPFSFCPFSAQFIASFALSRFAQRNVGCHISHNSPIWKEEETFWPENIVLLTQIPFFSSIVFPFAIYYPSPNLLSILISFCSAPLGKPIHQSIHLLLYLHFFVAKKVTAANK
jgi:hypothetical protein